jgi:hypothetical protein
VTTLLGSCRSPLPNGEANFKQCHHRNLLLDIEVDPSKKLAPDELKDGLLVDLLEAKQVLLSRYVCPFRTRIPWAQI